MAVWWATERSQYADSGLGHLVAEGVTEEAEYEEQHDRHDALGNKSWRKAELGGCATPLCGGATEPGWAFLYGASKALAWIAELPVSGAPADWVPDSTYNTYDGAC